MRPTTVDVTLGFVLVCLTMQTTIGADQLTVYPAKTIITMDPSAPKATAVGTMETLQPWLDAHEYQIDDTFRDKVLLPGFIDPHLHPGLGARLLSQNEIITPEDWDLPSGFVEGVTDRTGYLTRLQELVDREKDSDKPFFTWGWNSYWHGPITRDDLDAVSATRPIVVTQRSSHDPKNRTWNRPWARRGPHARSGAACGDGRRRVVASDGP